MKERRRGDGEMGFIYLDGGAGSAAKRPPTIQAQNDSKNDSYDHDSQDPAYDCVVNMRNSGNFPYSAKKRTR